MPSNQKTYFCRQLASWLFVTEWHFTTLLAACIDSVNELPNDADDFINSLLWSFSERPAKQELKKFVNDSSIIEHWFRRNLAQPRVRSFSLESFYETPKLDVNFPQFDGLPDLAYWLGISLAQLEWLADLRRVDFYEPSRYKHYHYSLVEKRRGGVRLIESPKTLLKRVQRQIYSSLLAKASVHSAAHGFRQSRGCLSHAENHTNQEYLFTFDLANYFHSIDWYRTYKVFRELGYADEIAKYLACLCTSRFNGPRKILLELDAMQGLRVKRRHLPQGAPTSPALSNLVMQRLDKRLDGLAKKLSLTYSRYADDLAFSGNKHRDWSFFAPLVGAICLEEEFELNHRKSRTVRSHQRQKVTGVVVNNGVNVDRRYYDQVKAILNNCLRHGIEDQNIDQHENFSEYLLGRITFINSLNASRGQKLFRIYRQINFD